MKFVTKPVALLATSALAVGGMAVTATAAQATGGLLSVVSADNIVKTTDPESEAANYNDWHYDPNKAYQQNAEDRRNGIFINGGTKVLIAKGNGNDKAVKIADRADKTGLKDVLNSIAIQASNTDSITYQVPVRWDVDGDGDWVKGVDGWSTLRKAPGDDKWLTSNEIHLKGEGVVIAKGATADAIAFDALQVYPIAAGFLAYDSPSDLLVSSFGVNGETTHFGKRAGAAEEWTGTEGVLAGGIAGVENAETYGSWHLGAGTSAQISDVAGSGKNEILGLGITGKAQVLRGFEDAEFLPNVADRASSMKIALVGEGEAWAQIPVYSYQPGVEERVFTTLRAQVPASGNLADATEWYTSYVVGDLQKFTPYSLKQILAGIGEHDVIGYGVFVDSEKSATVSSITYNGKTTSFARAAETPTGGTVVLTDVPKGAKFNKEITWLAENRITTGVKQADGTVKFMPKESVTREAMAAFIYRLNAEPGYKAPKQSPFADVPTTHKFYKQIAWLNKAGIAKGTKQPSGKPLFDPSSNITREAMAAFLYRAAESTTPAPKTSPFADISTKRKFFKEIAWMHKAGISTGTKQPSGKPKYLPGDNTTREATAAFLYRADQNK